MMVTEEEARAKVAALVARFTKLTPEQARSYNEENTKKDFVLPLFEALGWETNNAAEVTAEERTSGGRVDYAFKVRNVPYLYLECKPLRTGLTDVSAVRQAITYAYHKGVTWAVLCNFTGLRVFNANLADPGLHTTTVLNLPAIEYEQQFERLWLLSRPAVEQRLLEEEARRNGQLPERVPIERRLYAQLRAWRERLFNEIAQYHPRYGPDLVDEVIQRLLNRLVFIRTCEDRRLEEGSLRAALNMYHGRQLKGKQPLLEELRRIFQTYDKYYDSDLFAKHQLDKAFLQDDTIATILQGLHAVPGALADYDFSLISADILGAVYEQYLGHVAQIAKRRQQEYQQRMDFGIPTDVTYEVTNKRQRRKEQGIYYTPEWIVAYIVRQTLGQFLEDHGDRPDAVHNVTVLDMACGSGSFLIHAYDTLLRWHAEHYGTPVELLTQEYRMPVLVNNIFGVDLDPQAVEIARLNLLLRALAQRQMLPSLRENVKRGNSLISGQEAELRPYFGASWAEKRPFNWEREFPKAMAQGGFDVVVGNPPYVETALIAASERDYFRSSYDTAHGLFDLYVLFLTNSIRLLNPGGRLGFITSGKFLRAQYGVRLCEYITATCTVETVVDLAGQKAVFGKEATNYPVILILKKGASANSFAFASMPAEPVIDTVAGLESIMAVHTKKATQNAFLRGVWPPPGTGEGNLLRKLEEHADRLGKIAELFHGLQTNADPVFILRYRRQLGNGLVRVYSHARHAEYELEESIIHPLLKGSIHMRRYWQAETDLLLLFPYYPSSATLLPPEEMASEFPHAWDYLQQNKAALEGRENSRWRGQAQWYGYTRRNNHNRFGTGVPRILTPSLARHASLSLDSSGLLYFVGSGGGGGGGYGIELKQGIRLSPLYVLGLLNSKMLDYYLHQVSSPFRGGYRAYNKQYIEPLPIRTLDLSKPGEKRQHEGVVALVEEMLAVQERLVPIRQMPSEAREELLRQVAQVDSAIDQAVYDLYGLTDAERRIVEETL